MISTHSRTSQLRIARSGAPRQGFSLIEVAIALVIFVIGALAIIRIFPGALSVIGNNGDQQVATNLNRSQLTDLQSVQVAATPVPNAPIVSGFAARATFNSVPSATFNNSNLDGTLSVLSWMTNPSLNHAADFRRTNSSVIGIPRFNETLPDTQDIERGTGLSSLSRYRAIVGEKTRIRDLTTYGSTGKYALTQFPVSVQEQGNPSVILPIKPLVSQEFELNDVRTTSNGALDFSRVRLDGDDNIVAASRSFSTGSMLYVSYRYYNSSDKIWGIREEAIPFGTTDLRNAVSSVKPPTGTRPDAARATAPIVPEIVEVKLRSYLGQGEFGDPSAQNDILARVADARRGLVLLPVPAAGLDANKPVMLDYIADWSFLLQEGVPSVSANATYPAFPTGPSAPVTPAYRQITLGVPFIEDQAPISIYSLLIESDKSFLSGYGTSYGATNQEPPSIDRMVRATDAANPEQREDELRSGRVTFIIDQDVPVRARVAYKTRDNWTQQLSVAAKTYKPSVPTAAAPSPEQWRDYYLNNGNGVNYLYFHAGEAGKAITVSYTLNDGAASRSFVDRPFVIESAQIDAGNLVPNSFTQGFYGKPGDPARVARVQLTNPAGGPLNTADLISIQAVKGVSITARTAYVNGTKYAQKIDTKTRGAY